MAGGGMSQDNNFNLRGLTMEEALARQRALGQAQMQQAMLQHQAWENHQRQYLEQQAIRERERYQSGWVDHSSLFGRTMEETQRPAFDRMPKELGVVITPRRIKLKSYHAVIVLTIFVVAMLLIWRTI